MPGVEDYGLSTLYFVLSLLFLGMICISESQGEILTNGFMLKGDHSGARVTLDKGLIEQL